MNKTIYFCLSFIVVIFSGYTSHSQTISAATSVFDTTLCEDVGTTISVAGCVSGLTVKTWFGDGTNTITPVSCSGASGSATFSHVYASSGTHTIKHVLYSGVTPIDSLTESRTIFYCSDVYLRTFVDANTNCLYDHGIDFWINKPSKFQVDSAGIPIDTIDVYSGAIYTTYGAPGTIYAYRILSPPYGALTTACPVSGVIYDTVPYSISSTYFLRDKYLAFHCSTTPGFDLDIVAGFQPALIGSAANTANIFIFNSSCTTTPATVKFEYSPKFTFGSIQPVTTSYTVAGTSVTFDAGIVSSNSIKFFSVKLNPVGTLMVGDTVNSKFTISPITGDTNPTNNIVTRCDNILGAWDPNHKSVSPSGDITGGTELEYMLEFENDGTDFAYNIHIMDTLSNYLDIYTLKGGVSSHNVNLIQLNNGSNNILKFDFPNIMLPDTTHHPVEQCRGMVTFSIKAKSPLTPGTTIANRVGIYFDTNPAVMTNTVYSMVPFPTSLQNSHLMQVELYPNPVNNKFTLKTDGNEYKATLYNITGQTISTYNILKNETQISTDQLTPGIYYVVLKGATGSKAIKFEKQ
jgi:hypothetical protein